MQKAGLIAAALLLAGCAGGQRWLDANKEDVLVDGIPYRIAWIRESGRIDTRSHRNESLVMLPDALDEKRRNVEAATIVARRECGANATVVTEAKNGDLFLTSLRCG